MKILRSAMLFAAAATLSNCCLSSTSCNAPLAAAGAPVQATATPVAAAAPDWDGFSAPQAAAMETDPIAVQPQRKQAKRRADGVDVMSARSSTGYRKDPDFEEQQVLDQADEDRLKQKLIICRNCSSAQ